jgi:putative peptide zinc metalloprotease protein
VFSVLSVVKKKRKMEQEQKTFTGMLRSDIKIQPVEARRDGTPEYLLFDPVSDKYFRIGEVDFQIIRALDRNYELQTFLKQLEHRGPEYSAQRVMNTLRTLRSSGLFMPEYGVGDKQLEQFKSAAAKAGFAKFMSTWLFFRLPPIKPDRFFTATADTVKTILNRRIIWFMTIVSIIGYLMLCREWNRIYTAFIESLSFSGLVRYSIAVVIIKIIHEFSHAYTAKIQGVRVRSMGIAFIVFFPRLFTDITDSWRLRRQQRLRIDSAGIVAELIIGGIAALIWVNIPPGAASSIAYYIFTVSVINTVLVNGNPFIRYDGYYILSDIIGIDNLLQRATAYTRRLWRKKLFGLETANQFPETHPLFMFCFAICSFVYRIFLFTSIILIVYFKFTKAVGILLFILEAYFMIIRPIMMEAKMVTAQKKQFKTLNLIISGSGIIILILLLLLPLPWQVSMPCEVIPLKSEMLYIEQPGFIVELSVKDGEMVKHGQLIIKLNSPFLQSQLQRLTLQQQRLQLELKQLRSSQTTLADAAVKQTELNNANTSIKDIKNRIEQLAIRAPLSGKLSLPEQKLQPGRWLNKGETGGEVFSPKLAVVTGFVDAKDSQALQQGDKVTILINGSLKNFSGTVQAINPVTAEFRESPLVNIFGGPIVCIPQPEKRNFKPVASIYPVIITVDADMSNNIGRTGTATIRKYSSLGGGILRKIFRTLLDELTF